MSGPAGRKFIIADEGITKTKTTVVKVLDYCYFYNTLSHTLHTPHEPRWNALYRDTFLFARESVNMEPSFTLKPSGVEHLAGARGGRL